MALTKVHNRMISGSVLSILDFGADPTGTADSTDAIQSAINKASNSDGRVVYIPAGKYNYTNIYCFYDASLNPDFNEDRDGEITIIGDGISPEDGSGFTGSVLYCTNATGDGFIVGNAGQDASPYPSRDFVCEGISFEGNNSGALVLCRGVISPKFDNVQFRHSNDAGTGLWITTAFFGTITRARFKNVGAGTKTGSAIYFGTTIASGLFTMRDVNIAGFSIGLNFYAGDWQLMSAYDSEFSGTDYAIYIGGGRLQTLNLYGCYFEGSSTSYIKSVSGSFLQQVQLNGCWFFALGATDPCIDLHEPSSVIITNTMAQDLRSAFLNIPSIPSGGVPNYMCQGVLLTTSIATPSAVTYFTGYIPALFGVQYPVNDPNVTLYPSTERPIEYDPSSATSSWISAGHLLETKVKDYGAVAGGSIDLAGDGYIAMAWLYNITTPTTVYLPAIATGIPHGFTATVTSGDASGVNPVVKTAIADGAATIATLSPGEQRKFVFFNDGVTTGWR